MATTTSTRRTRNRLVGIVAGYLVLAAVVSYTMALLEPGYATWSDKTSTWIRDHGGGPMLNVYENWLYAKPPADTQPDMTAFANTAPAPNGPAAGVALPELPAVPGQPAPQWNAGRVAVDGVPAAYTAVFQPDPAHRSAVAGVAVVPAAHARAHLVAGTAEPGGSPEDAHIPAADVPSLVAAFNSGFKLHDITGGFYLHGTAAKDLVDGAASAVIDDTGRLSVAQWGRDVAMNPHITAVRQNLALIVDHGALAPDSAPTTTPNGGRPRTNSNTPTVPRSGSTPPVIWSISPGTD